MSDRAADLRDLPADGWVLTPDLVLTPQGPRRGWSVAVDGGQFVRVGPADAVCQARPDLVQVPLPGTAIIPGFVDTHQHLTQVFAKALVGGQPAQVWRRMWLPLYEAMSPDDAYVAAKWTCAEALRGGFTTIVTAGERDPAKIDPIEQAIADTGIRAIVARDFSDLSLSDLPETNGSTAALAATATRYLAATPNARIKRSVACASPQSASVELIGTMARLAGEAETIFQIHVSEHTPEIQWSLETYGVRPIEMLHDIAALGPATLLAHATLATAAEITLIADGGAAVSYNPVASAWKGNAIAPALEFADRGIRFGLGTDATRADGFRLLDAAESAQRFAFGMRVDDWRSGSGELWVRAATTGGASAASLDDVGEIREGQCADFLVLDTTAPELTPSWDFEWELVRYFDRSHLAAVFVGGEAVVIDGQPTGWDLAAFVAASESIARRVVTEAELTLVGADRRLVT